MVLSEQVPLKTLPESNSKMRLDILSDFSVQAAFDPIVFGDPTLEAMELIFKMVGVGITPCIPLDLSTRLSTSPLP